MTSHIKQPPKAVGLYDPRFEHDACGVGMVARLDNLPTHEVVSRAITALENLEHRGANGADPRTGDDQFTTLAIDMAEDGFGGRNAVQPDRGFCKLHVHGRPPVEA